MNIYHLKRIRQKYELIFVNKKDLVVVDHRSRKVTRYKHYDEQLLYSNVKRFIQNYLQHLGILYKLKYFFYSKRSLKRMDKAYDLKVYTNFLIEQLREKEKQEKIIKTREHFQSIISKADDIVKENRKNVDILKVKKESETNNTSQTQNNE